MQSVSLPNDTALLNTTNSLDTNSTIVVEPPSPTAPPASSGFVFFTVSEKAFLNLLGNSLYSYSILTVYFTVVFSLGRFMRLYVQGMSLVSGRARLHGLQGVKAFTYRDLLLLCCAVVCSVSCTKTCPTSISC